MIGFLTRKFEQAREQEAIVWLDRSYTYARLLALLGECRDLLATHEVPPGAPVSLEGDFSPRTVAMLLALIENRNVVVPLADAVKDQREIFLDTAQVQYRTRSLPGDDLCVTPTGAAVTHELLSRLAREEHPGLVLFSSGSTGASKAAVHDLVPLLEKFELARQPRRMLTFLLFDHIGGLNTLLYCLSNAGCMITVADRNPDKVAECIEKHRVEVLPTSPTFLNLLLLSGAHEEWDLSSLSLVTYGTEMMPESTLARLREALPGVQMLQTYGLSEVGILRSKSESSDSLWVKIGGEGFETRVVDGMLEIKARSAMLGYLNAPSPFSADGWLKTGDAVEIRGEYFRFLGRKSEIINVGGEKVYPAEVESAVQEVEGVEDVAVTGEPHPLTGQIVTARVCLSTGESARQFRIRMKKLLADKLPAYKIPQKVTIDSHHFHGERFKKMRL